jgi:hypothetical protein
MVFYVLSITWVLLGLYMVFYKLYRRKIIFKILRENKSLILKNIKTDIKDGDIIEISKEELKTTKDSFISLIKPHIGSNEINLYEKQMSLGDEYNQLDYLNSILNSSGATNSVTFVFKDINEK